MTHNYIWIRRFPLLTENGSETTTVAATYSERQPTLAVQVRNLQRETRGTNVRSFSQNMAQGMQKTTRSGGTFRAP